jgi:aldehyde dehydrogenase (NAD+)
MLRNLHKWMAPRRESPPLALFPGSCDTVREPLGVVTVIGAWNFPIDLLVLPLMGALAAGNCCAVKPSEVAPATAAVLGEMLQRRLDARAVAVVQGGARETQALLDCHVDHIFYTGGERVAHVVADKARRHLTPVTLELGGKNPCIVERDANLAVAARRIAWGRFTNAGQICISPDYVLCHRAVLPAFVAQLKATVAELYGADPRASGDFARIVNHAHFDRLADLLSEPPEVAGQLLFGGLAAADRATRYMPPTALVGTRPESKLMQSEIFGPVLPIVGYDSLDEALALVRARPKPLAVYLFSSRKDAQRRVLERTSSGTVGFNEVVMQYLCPQLPFGGVGASGLGKYRGRHSFELFSHARAVLDRSDSALLDVPARYPPMTPAKQFILSRVL